MNLHIRPYKNSDSNELAQLTYLAFEPVFTSFKKILGPKIYPIIYPDWRKTQKEGVEMVSTDEKYTLLVAEADGKVVGYLAYELHENDKSGEVQLLAVHPDFQNQGVGTALNIYALQNMKEAGMNLAVVGTGGDESHAPARRSYEKAGYTALPLVRYYKDL